MNNTIIGIDLGTTNSEVAVVENGQVTVIKNQGSPMLPSVVGWDQAGQVLVGTPAKNQYELYPESTVKSIKRRMGTDHLEVIAGQSYRPEEISAIILRQLKTQAENHLGHAVSQAVITVPAYFSDIQRHATREAAQIAGLEVVRMINEPTAAALAYEITEKSHKKALIYDLGGGTFDVSVVSLQDDVVEVLASHGNNQLGGDDFDAKICDALLAHLTEQGVDISTDPLAMARIHRAAEEAKIKLSSAPYALIEEEFLTSNETHLSFELAREDYQEMIRPFIDETLEAVHIALDGAGLTSSDIDEILLVGGSTRTPLIQQNLKDLFQLQPRSEINPDLCVAMGAAMQAANIAGHDVSAVLLDITPYTFGTSALGEKEGMEYPFVYVPVIAKNAVLPVQKSEVFYTVVDGQESVEVNIYQGENRDALENISIGQFLVEGLGDVPAGSPIVLTLALDLDGILEVTAREKETGLEKSITIDNSMAKHDQQSIENARSRIQSLFGEETPGDQHKENQLAVQARALVDKARAMLESVSQDDQEDIIEQIEGIEDALAEKDQQALTDAVEQISDLIYYLES